MRGPLILQSSRDRLEYAVDVAGHVVIPETQDAITMPDKPPISYGVTFVRRVLPAVDLDDKALFAADKIDDERTSRLLADEFETAE